MQQRPTLENVRIRSTRDALQVFYGVARQILPLITRRLDAEERKSIVPGNVYVWEERGANTEATGLGMERWTDGMGWGPSRVRDEFLFYHQKESDMPDDIINPVTPWAHTMRKRDQNSSQSSNRLYLSSNSRAAMPREPELLIKQTYSVHVSLPEDRLRNIIRKWHLTAYFSHERLNGLKTIDHIPGVGDVLVPDGWFRSARASKSRRDNREFSHGASQSPEAVSRPSTTDYRIDHHSNAHHRGGSTSDFPLSGSPEPSYPENAMSPSTSSPSSRRFQPHFGDQLVPLEYLMTLNNPRRDPTDEQLLKRFSS